MSKFAVQTLVSSAGNAAFGQSQGPGLSLMPELPATTPDVIGIDLTHTIHTEDFAAAKGGPEIVVITDSCHSGGNTRDAGGVPRKGGVTPPFEHKEGDDMTYTDGWITREALKQMDGLAAKDQPFFLAVGIMKPHLPFACPKSYLDIYKDVKLAPIPHPQKPEGLSTWWPPRCPPAS